MDDTVFIVTITDLSTNKSIHGTTREMPDTQHFFVIKTKEGSFKTIVKELDTTGYKYVFTAQNDREYELKINGVEVVS